MPVYANHRLQFSVPPSTREYQYQDKRHFHDVLLSLSVEATDRSQYIIFSDIAKDRFLKDISEDINIDSYIPGSQLLLIKVPTKAHEVAYMTFHELLLTKIHGMDLRSNKLVSLGKADVATPTRQKQPDLSYCPLHLPPGRTRQWPTMVVECGYSESKAKLAADARWWLAESQGEVAIAITISVHNTRREIIMELWGMVARPTRADPAKKVPAVEHRVVVSQGKAPQQQKVNVATGATTTTTLTISFRDLFLRPAETNEGGRDLVFSEQDLRSIAETVWEMRENI